MTWDRFRIARETGADPNDPKLVEYDDVVSIAMHASRMGVSGDFIYPYYEALKDARRERARASR